jgi:hypothetical protein
LLGYENLVRTLIIMQLASINPVSLVVYVFPELHNVVSGIAGQVAFGCAVCTSVTIVDQFLTLKCHPLLKVPTVYLSAEAVRSGT